VTVNITQEDSKLLILKTAWFDCQ